MIEMSGDRSPTLMLATVLVTLFFPYRALAAHQGVEDKIRGGSGINKPNTVASYVLAT